MTSHTYVPSLLTRARTASAITLAAVGGTLLGPVAAGTAQAAPPPGPWASRVTAGAPTAPGDGAPAGDSYPDALPPAARTVAVLPDFGTFPFWTPAAGPDGPAGLPSRPAGTVPSEDPAAPAPEPEPERERERAPGGSADANADTDSAPPKNPVPSPRPSRPPAPSPGQRQPGGDPAAGRPSTPRPEASAPGGSAPEASASSGVRALRVAASKQGAPYRYGAEGPHQFDCSGLTQYAFQQAGKELPRTAAAQYDKTLHIPASRRRPGDLVFFGTGRNIHHVGIYAGDGMMWHSPKTGDTVRLEKIWSEDVRYGRVR